MHGMAHVAMQKLRWTCADPTTPAGKKTKQRLFFRAVGLPPLAEASGRFPLKPKGEINNIHFSKWRYLNREVPSKKRNQNSCPRSRTILSIHEPSHCSDYGGWTKSCTAQDSMENHCLLEFTGHHIILEFLRWCRISNPARRPQKPPVQPPPLLKTFDMKLLLLQNPDIFKSTSWRARFTWCAETMAQIPRQVRKLHGSGKWSQVNA